MIPLIEAFAEELLAPELPTRARRAVASLNSSEGGRARLAQMPQDLGTIEAPTLTLVLWLESKATAAVLADHWTRPGFGVGVPPSHVGWDFAEGCKPSPEPSTDQKPHTDPKRFQDPEE